ncbi:MAG: hypothetical protein EBY24_14290, partial [Betaproteobacteria bacterium]|nr:hypothetical protein [Betaproteobacteria bacterium]
CADINGFSLHAAVRCAADDRQALEQLCRYITRPALANDRVQCNAAGQVVLKLKTAWRDGTTHLVMSPLEFMQRLAALVPRPRLHLIRFHGVLGIGGIGNPTTRAQISSLQPPSKPAFCLRRHDHWADHWASPGPDAALTRPFGATGSATSTARPTARSRRRSVCPLTNRCVDRARHRVLPGLTRPSPGRLAPPARHHLHPVRHTRPKAAARAPGRWAAPGRPHRCAPGSA